MKKFILHGRLGETIGKEFNFAVSSIAEGLRAIQCVSKGALFDYLLEGDARGVGYRVLIGKTHLTHELELVHSFNDKVEEIHFFPDVQGAASPGLFQVLIGVVMIAAAIASMGTSLAASGGLWGSYTAALATKGAIGFFAMMGTAMVLGGVSQLIVGQPKAGSMGESPANNASYLFTGAVNTTRQGGPIPVGYGEMIIGSQVISLSVRTARIASDTDAEITGADEPGAGGSGSVGNPYPTGYPRYTPISWVRLPEPLPIPVEGLEE